MPRESKEERQTRDREATRLAHEAKAKRALVDRRNRRLLITGVAAGTAIGLGVLAAVTSPSIARFINRQGLIQETEQARAASGRVFEGRNPHLKGARYLDSGSLIDFITALQDTQHPFLVKLSRDITQISRPEPHPEFTSMAKIATPSPFSILETPSKTSTVSVMPLYKREDPNTVNFVSPDGTSQVKLIEEVEYSITVGRDSIFKQSSSLAQGLFLAKETISLAMEIAYERDYWKLVEDLKLGSFTQIDGTPITETQAKQEAGASLFHFEMTDSSSLTWKSIDALPILLLGSIAKGLAQRKLFAKQDDRILGPFQNAESLISKDIALSDQVRRFIQTWNQEGTFIPSYSLVREATQGKLLEAATKTKTP